MRCLFSLVGIVTLALFDLRATSASAGDHDVQKTIGYLECKDANGETARGSGVIVSSQGDVITAHHVVRSNDAKCKGSIGVADPDDVRKLNVQAITNLGVDVALLRF